MLIIAVSFLLLGVFNGILGNEEMCSKGVFPECIDGNKFPPLETEEDYDKSWNILLNVVKCCENFVDTCYAEDDPTRDLRKGILEKVKVFFTVICNKDSKLRKAFLKNTDCLKATYDKSKHICDGRTQTILESYTKIVGPPHEGKGMDYEEDLTYWTNYMCLNQGYDAACLAIETSKRCGHSAKNVVATMFSHFYNHLDEMCHTEEAEDLEDILESLEIETGTRLQLKKILKFD